MHEVHVRLHERAVEVDAVQRRQHLQPDRVGAEDGLDDVAVGGWQQVEVLATVDRRDDRLAREAQLDEVPLALHVAPARQRVDQAGAPLRDGGAEGVVRLPVVDHRAAVADEDEVERVHQSGRVERRAEGDVEVLAQLS